MTEPRRHEDHWLTRPKTIRGLWVVFGIILAITVGLQFLFKVKGSFELDGTFGFGAWFGFGACVAMVLVARILGWALKRSEDYYADELPPESGGADDA